MPVPAQGPAAHARHRRGRGATREALVRASPREADRCAAARNAVHDQGPRCHGRRRSSADRPGTGQSAGRRAGSSRAQRRTGPGGIIGMGLGAGGIASGCTVGHLQFLAGEILAAAIIIAPLLTGTVLVTVVVFGTTKSSDRVFRLLRCFSGKEEPPAPSPATTETPFGTERLRTGRSARDCGRLTHDRSPH